MTGESNRECFYCEQGTLHPQTSVKQQCTHCDRYWYDSATYPSIIKEVLRNTAVDARRWATNHYNVVRHGSSPRGHTPTADACQYKYCSQSPEFEFTPLDKDDYDVCASHFYRHWAVYLFAKLLFVGLVVAPAILYALVV